MIFHTKGTVVKGFQRGRMINIKTANLLVPQPCNLEDGVFSGWAKIKSDGITYPAVISYGTNPTFDNKEKRLEVHILETFPSDFYGATLYVAIQRRLRAPVKFPCINSLKKQICDDIQAAQADFIDAKKEDAMSLFAALDK